jgi:AbrB family looped-hinge helix DNA binding protein
MADGIHDGMNTRLKVDAAGRIVLPKPLRRHFRLEPGDLLGLEVTEDAIILRPEAHAATLVEENGLLVHEGEPRGDLLRAVETAREGRDRDTAGPIG